MKKDEILTLLGAYTGCLFLVVPWGLILYSVFAGISLADTLYVYSSRFGAVLFAVFVPVSFLALARSMRPWVGLFWIVSSFVYAFILLTLALCMVNWHWGKTGLVISIFLGPGVVPMSFVAALFSSDWGGLLFASVLLALVLVTRFGGIAMATSLENK